MAGIKEHHLRSLKEFIESLGRDVYPEPVTTHHTGITIRMIDHLASMVPLPLDATILDIGCGSGAALLEFRKRGYSPVGAALGRSDLQACRDLGFDVHEMDQSFLDFEDHSFDLIWCRHCLEHSFSPYFTLQGFRRALREEGFLYVEVPAPGTSCRHEANPNHYSVLGKEMWCQLMTRAGFAFRDIIDIEFKVAAGPDVYWAFILQASNEQRNTQTSGAAERSQLVDQST